ncbi:MAG: hypothetical protein IKG47_04200 [Oscillospiraceae bacterium]|nr:hypothetical protein [Oscillospiraceae bacterium]
MTITFNSIEWSVHFVSADDKHLNYDGEHIPFLVNTITSDIYIQAEGISRHMIWLSLANAVSRAISFSHGVSFGDYDSIHDYMSKYCDDVISAGYLLYTEYFREKPPVFAD